MYATRFFPFAWLLITIVLSLSPTQLNAQIILEIDWVNTMGGPGEDGCGPMITDSDGNIYLTGRFEDSADLDPGPDMDVFTSNGSYDIYVQKLDSAGHLLWVRQIGGPGIDLCYGITLDHQGNLYLTGIYQQTTDFDPGSGAYNLTSNGERDMFIMKLDGGGNFLWAKSIGGPYSDYGIAIAYGPYGYLYLTGYYVGTVDFDPGPDTMQFTAIGYNDIFVLKLDPDGDFVWLRTMGGVSYDSGLDLVLDDYEFVYVTGRFQGVVDFDPGPDSLLAFGHGSFSTFILKLDPAGNLEWANTLIGAPGTTNIGRDIAIDPVSFLYVTGYFDDSVDFDPGPGTYYLGSAGQWDAFLLKLSSTGTFQWAGSVGGKQSDFGNGVSADDEGNVLWVGTFDDTADFDPGPGVHQLVSEGMRDSYVAKVAGTGEMQWVFSQGGALNDGVNNVITYNGKILVSGSFSDSLDFDPGPGVHHAASAGQTDAYMYALSDQVLGTTNVSRGANIRCYPNPTNGALSLWFEQPHRSISLEVMDVWGRVLERVNASGIQSVNLNLNGSPGIYLIRCLLDDQLSLLKVVKD